MLDAAPPASWVGLEVSRQRGKTFAVLSWALQRMGLKPGLAVVYLAQTGSNAESIVAAFLRDIEETLPPEWGACVKDGALRLRNGSELAFFGTDNQQYRRRRGRKAQIVLLDESAFYADLDDVEQVYSPQLQTTGGIGVYLSSPPISPSHTFSRRMRALRAAGRFIHDTFWSNPRINHEHVIAGECGRTGLTREQLLASTAFRREFLAEEVAEESRLALPAWPQFAELLVGDWQRPTYWDGYQAHDPGITGDPHASLFAFHDPESNTLTVESELELRSASVTVRAWADTIKERERELYGATSWDGTIIGARDWQRDFGILPEYLQTSIRDGAPRQPYLRVGDNASGICKEMSAEHRLALFPVDKHEKAFHVDTCNGLIVQKRLRIHRRCVRLIEQMHTTIWNASRSGWERTDKDHGDLLDDLVYLSRSVRWHRDCRPPPVERFVVPEHMTKKKTGLDALRGVF